MVNSEYKLKGQSIIDFVNGDQTAIIKIGNKKEVNVDDKIEIKSEQNEVIDTVIVTRKVVCNAIEVYSTIQNMNMRYPADNGGEIMNEINAKPSDTVTVIGLSNF